MQTPCNYIYPTCNTCTHYGEGLQIPQCSTQFGTQVTRRWTAVGFCCAHSPLLRPWHTVHYALSDTRAPRGFPGEQFTNHCLPLWASKAASVKNKLLWDLLAQSFYSLHVEHLLLSHTGSLDLPDVCEVDEKPGALGGMDQTPGWGCCH